MIERIQWTCPICKRRFAIPATAPTPSRCPQCRENEQAAGGRTAVPVRTADAIDDEPDGEEDALQPAGLSALAAIQLEVAEEAARGPMTVTATVRQGGPSRKTLKAIVPIYAALAGLAVVGAFAGLLYGLRTALVMEPNAARTVAIFQAIGAFVAGLVAAFLFFSFREVIRVLLDIEDNSRRS